MNSTTAANRSIILLHTPLTTHETYYATTLSKRLSHLPLTPIELLTKWQHYIEQLHNIWFGSIPSSIIHKLIIQDKHIHGFILFMAENKENATDLPPD